MAETPEFGEKGSGTTAETMTIGRPGMRPIGSNASRGRRMLSIITAFIFKHFICDFPLQRAYQYLNKGKYGHPGGIVHAGIHAAGTLLVCLGFGLPPYLAAVDGLIHYHVDWAKVQLNDHWKLRPDNSEYYWWLLGLDQFVHYMTYVFLIWLAV